MTLSRRRMIALLGGGLVVTATAGATGFAVTRTPTRALAPWAAAGTFGEARLDALSWAILAPNPHNRQPWEAALMGEDRIRITRDLTRNLPHTDPYDRQMTIGMGCFLEQFVIAASASGHAVDLTLFPEGGEHVVAEARFLPGAVRDPLFDALPNRRSCKEPFSATPVPDAALASLAPLARTITDAALVEKIRALTWAAWEIEARTPRTYRESVDLMRFGKAEINANPDGIDLGGPFLEGLALFGMLSREGQMNPDSAEYKQGFDMYRTMLAATPTYAVITTEGNSRTDQIAAGRRWLRLNLTTTALGLALHPVSQALQEYPEMAGPYAAVHTMLAPSGGTVQMLGRLGFGPTPAQTPRWPLETRMRNA